MNKEDIIRMAREARLSITTAYGEKPALERFAALVAAAEREAITAKLIELGVLGEGEFIKTIRARGETK